MPNRARDRFAQAERDLEQAGASQRDGRHEWACFAAQQAAEMAVKALHLSLAQDTTMLPVPADLVIYTDAEWRELERGNGRFARTLARETVWVFPG